MLIPLIATFVNSSVTNDKVGLIPIDVAVYHRASLHVYNGTNVMKHRHANNVYNGTNVMKHRHATPPGGWGRNTDGLNAGRMGVQNRLVLSRFCYKAKFIAPWYLHIDRKCCYVVMVWPTGPMAWWVLVPIT